MTEPSPEIASVLRERFALERFRPGQREVIEAVLDGRDVLCVMPTGGGKSLCYQLPAVARHGLTLVVSPLIALMKDQVDALQNRGIRATLINSTLSPDEQRSRIVEAELGQHELVYVAPERFRSHRFVEAMNRARPVLLAIDEAHCISEWGHDFRPDYARLGEARRQMGSPPCIALTATATDQVRRDIAQQLELRDPAHFVTGFDRPNLSYEVIDARREADKQRQLSRLLEEHAGPSIIYASSRKRCEEVASFVRHELRRSVVVYHAGLEREARHQAQDDFMQSRAEVVVATNAFGMGVDKPDIRSVIHYNLPGTIEAYYQEAGRAGRDGDDSTCALLYSPGDIKLQQLFIENQYPPRDVIYRIYDHLRTLDADPIQLSHAEIKEQLGLELGDGAVGSSLKILEGAGALERFDPRENMALVRIRESDKEGPLVDRLSAQAQVQRLVMKAIEAMVNGRFGEPIYFHPEELSSALGVERTSLTRALRELTSSLPVDYIPPFRGQAIRIRDRNIRSRALDIDFSHLEDRKRLEYNKLDRIIRYAESPSCRRAIILEYFGEPCPSQCGRCDRCASRGLARPSSNFSVDTPASREVLLKVLSGVARTKGKFGKTVVSQMLAGSGSEQIRNSWVARLSTFGILEHGGFTQPELTSLVDSLTSAGLVESRDVGNFKPVVSLSDRGWEWLRGRGDSPLELSLDPSLALKLRQGGLPPLNSNTAPAASTVESPSAPDAPSASDGLELDARLRALRLRLAKEFDLSPAYVFTNETLDQLVRDRPTTPAALARIKGIGPSKLDRFGRAIVEVVTASSPASALESPPPPDPSPSRIVTVPVDPPDAPPDDPNPLSPRERMPAGQVRVLSQEPEAAPPSPTPEDWTLAVLDRGFSLSEAAQIRRLDLSTIASHLTTLSDRGTPIDVSRWLPPSTLSAWHTHLATHGPDSPPADDLSPLWALFLSSRAAGSPAAC